MSSHKPIHWRRNVLALTASIATLLLVACGGGGGDDGGNPPSIGTSQGSISTPVTVTVGVPHSGTVASFGTSFYTFTPPTTARYRISLTNLQSDLSWALSNVGFTTLVQLCDVFLTPTNETCLTNSTLTGGLPQYLAVDEWDLIPGTFTLLIEPAVMVQSLFGGLRTPDGTWARCKFDSIAGHDTREELVITGTSLTRRLYNYTASTNGTCGGAASAPVTTLFTLATNSDKTMVGGWTNGTTTVVAPMRASTTAALPSQPFASRVVITGASTELDMWYIDDSTAQHRLYRGDPMPTSPCGLDGTGYESCLLNQYWLKQ